MTVFLVPVGTWSFLAAGGWLILPEPWSTVAAVAVYGLAALFWLSTKVADRRSRP